MIRKSGDFIYPKNVHRDENDNIADVCDTLECVLREAGRSESGPVVIETYYGSRPQQCARKLFVIVDSKVAEVHWQGIPNTYSFRPPGRLASEAMDLAHHYALSWFGNEDNLTLEPGARVIVVSTVRSERPDGRDMVSNTDRTFFKLSHVDTTTS